MEGKWEPVASIYNTIILLPTPRSNALFTFTQQLPVVANLAPSSNSATPTPPCFNLAPERERIHPNLEQSWSSSLSSWSFSLGRELLVIFSRRDASGATVDANPRYLRTVLLSLSVSSPVKRERSWVWSRISRIARFVTSIQGPKACCATLRRLPSFFFFFFFFFSRGITVRVFSPPTGHRHGPSGVSIDRARPKLSPNRLDPMRSKLIVPA